jgi:hypothetical protein
MRVSVSAIPAALGNRRGTHHDAVFPAGHQVPLDPEPARPGFIHEMQKPVGRPERAHHLVERLEIAGDHAVVADLSVPLPFSNRDVDRFLVDIQAYEHATVLRDLPPRVSCGVMP